MLKLLASYAYKERKNIDNRFKLGEGLVGQCALEKEKILLTDVPSDYIKITSGLGEAKPLNIIVLPDRVRRPGEGGHGAGQLRPVQPDARDVPRSAHRIDRHRAQHDRSEHAHCSQAGSPYRKISQGTISGAPTPQAVVQAFMADPTYKNQVLGDFTQIGVGYATAADGTPSWSILFGVPQR